jgi:hypothetical protein
MDVKWSLDEQDVLNEVLFSDGYQVIKKLLQAIAADKVKRLMSYDLARGSEGLVHEKARAEGAQKVITDLEAYKQKLNKKSDK